MNRFAITTGLLLSITAMTSCHKTPGGDNHSTSENAPRVSVAQPTVEDIVLSKTYPGTLVANSEIDVVCKASGQVLSKTFTKGTMVTKGQVLYTIDASSYRDKLNQAQAALTTAISARDYASDHYTAVRKALESDAVSKIEVSQAESALRQAEASVKNAEAALQNARRQLSYCTVTAPISGRISSGAFSSGSFIAGSESSPVKVTTIYDNTVMEAQFAIEDDRFLELIKAQADNDSLDFAHLPVRFSEPLPHDYTGRLVYLAPALNQSTGTMKTSCVIENPHDDLRQGMYVKIDLPYARLKNAILVKDSSIGSDQLGKYLYTVNDSGIVQHTPVTIGDLYQDSLRVITDGITPGTRYVTRAMLKVKSGMKVDPVLE